MGKEQGQKERWGGRAPPAGRPDPSGGEAGHLRRAVGKGEG